MARTLFGTKKKKMNETRKEKKIAMFRTNFDWIGLFLFKMQGNKNHFMNFTYRFAIMFIILFELWFECQLNLS